MNNKTPTPKLSLEQDKRLSQSLVNLNIVAPNGKVVGSYTDMIKQHLANELHLQALKYIEQVEGMKDDYENIRDDWNLVSKSRVLEILKKDL